MSYLLEVCSKFEWLAFKTSCLAGYLHALSCCPKKLNCLLNNLSWLLIEKSFFLKLDKMLSQNLSKIRKAAFSSSTNTAGQPHSCFVNHLNYFINQLSWFLDQLSCFPKMCSNLDKLRFKLANLRFNLTEVLFAPIKLLSKLAKLLPKGGNPLSK